MGAKQPVVIASTGKVEFEVIVAHEKRPLTPKAFIA